MASGMWTAASGAAAQSQNLDVIANNLANSDTPAFKKDTPTFKEYLANVERDQGAQDIPRGAIKDKDFYPIDGRDQSFVVMDGTHVVYRQGTLRVTQGQFDVALDGPGFLEVATPNGIRYTRQGSLKVMPDGRLVTTQGYPILNGSPDTPGGADGGTVATLPNLPSQMGRNIPGQIAPELASRYINLKDKGVHFTIDGQGDIFAGENLVGKLTTVEFHDLRKLKKYGDQLFENLDGPNRVPPTQTLIRQGVLETSNVSPIEEMTNLIKANRLFEEDLKALKTYNEMMGREANDVGKL